MSELKIHNNISNSIFRLVGNDENALTFALGYVFKERSDILIDFLKDCGIIKKLKGKNYNKDFINYSVHLQQYNDNKSGIKDVAIEDVRRKQFKIVIEAKTDGSIPSAKQLYKYTDYKINKEWVDYKEKTIVVLTRKIISDKIYQDAKQQLKSLGIELKIVSWSQVYKLIYKYRFFKAIDYKDRIVHELNTFLMEDYNIKYFENEILYRKIRKEYYQNIYGTSGKGYYFDGGRKSLIYPSCLFFMGCYGPARSSKKYADMIRRIDKYYITTADEIIKSGDKELISAFKKHLSLFSGDSKIERIHVFELGDAIRIPDTKRSFNAGDFGYKKLTDILAF